jgi:hypothetical protein
MTLAFCLVNHLKEPGDVITTSRTCVPSVWLQILDMLRKEMEFRGAAERWLRRVLVFVSF